MEMEVAYKIGDSTPTRCQRAFFFSKTGERESRFPEIQGVVNSLKLSTSLCQLNTAQARLLEAGRGEGYHELFPEGNSGFRDVCLTSCCLHCPAGPPSEKGERRQVWQVKGVCPPELTTEAEAAGCDGIPLLPRGCCFIGQSFKILAFFLLLF